MIVVSDTSPLNYLVLIGQVELLHVLYAQVLIPLAVYEELQREGTPRPVRDWISQAPKWLQIYRDPLPLDPDLNRLGPGERQAIALVEKLRDGAILIDERDGRRTAQARHLVVIGTLQILASAAEKGLIDLPAAFSKLQATNFRASARLMKMFLDQDYARRRPSGDPT